MKGKGHFLPGSRPESVLHLSSGIMVNAGENEQVLMPSFCALQITYTHFDEDGTVTMGRYQNPRASMGHLISNFLPDGTLSAFTFSLFCFSKINLLIVYHFGFGQPKKV